MVNPDTARNGHSTTAAHAATLPRLCAPIRSFYELGRRRSAEGGDPDERTKGLFDPSAFPIPGRWGAKAEGSRPTANSSGGTRWRQYVSEHQRRRRGLVSRVGIVLTSLASLLCTAAWLEASRAGAASVETTTTLAVPTSTTSSTTTTGVISTTSTTSAATTTTTGVVSLGTTEPTVGAATEIRAASIGDAEAVDAAPRLPTTGSRTGALAMIGLGSAAAGAALAIRRRRPWARP